MKKTALVFLWILLASGISACGKQASAEGERQYCYNRSGGGKPRKCGDPVKEELAKEGDKP